MITKGDYFSNDLPRIMMKSSENSNHEVLQKIKGLLEVPPNRERSSHDNSNRTDNSSGDSQKNIDEMYHQSIVSEDNVQMIG